MQEKDFLTVKMLSKDPSCPFTERALRCYIWRAKKNGLERAIYRIGDRVFIKRSEWIKWIESHSPMK